MGADNISSKSPKKSYLRRIIRNPTIMNPGKNRCEYLKEVRRRIATENDIPLEQRECTFKGECSGTCPFCEAEMRYLEKELHKRRTLGKAVTVAGIALSSVVMNACYTPTQLPGDVSAQTPAFESAEPTTIREAYEAQFVRVRGNVSTGEPVYVIDGMKIRVSDPYVQPAKFPAELGQPVLWLRQRLRSYSTYMSDELLNDALVTFVVNKDGTVSDVDFANMPVTGSTQDFDFQNEVRKQLLSMPRWEPATKADVPVSYPVAIAVSDLR